MAQPKFVPSAPAGTTPYYQSPPSRERSWEANRPGDTFLDGQPRGAGLGSQGPDQGFALKLARRFEDRLVLGKKESADDAIAGCVAVAMKRASLYGRAPMVHDVKAAFNLFGFFDNAMSEKQMASRADLFAEVDHHHHYAELRRIPDMVPAEILRQTPSEIGASAVKFRSMIFG